MNKLLLDEMTRLKDELEKIQNMLLEIPEIDGHYSELLEDIKKENPKMKKNERIKVALKLAREACPNFFTIMDRFDLIAEGIELRIDEARDKLEQKLESLEEIEDLQNDLEEKKSELDL